MRTSLLLGLLVLSLCLSAFRYWQNTPDLPEWPNDWPRPSYDFSQNPTTEEGFELGRRLFYDPALSRDNTISCASCHLSFTGFTHVDHAVSHGIDGRKGTRNAPALFNLIWQRAFHWDGGVNHLDAQAINPLTHPAEMDNSLEAVLAYLNGSSEYKAQFYTVFGDSIVTTSRVMKALSQFTTSLISSHAKYDLVQNGEAVFTEQEQKGYALFTQYCASCHQEPLFQKQGFASNGLPMDTNYRDLGRYAITKNPKDSMHFKIPSLRNIEVTFPYMHDGRFGKLSQVLDHYTTLDPSSPHLSRELKSTILLTSNQKKDLIAFLYTLTDRAFLYNPRFGFPR